MIDVMHLDSDFVLNQARKFFYGINFQEAEKIKAEHQFAINLGPGAGSLQRYFLFNNLNEYFVADPNTDASKGLYYGNWGVGIHIVNIAAPYTLDIEQMAIDLFSPAPHETTRILKMYADAGATVLPGVNKQVNHWPEVPNYFLSFLIDATSGNPGGILQVSISIQFSGWHLKT